MKLYVIMEKDKKYNLYGFKGSSHPYFGSILKILNRHFSPGELIDWLWNEKQRVISTDFVSIEKEKGKIALYNISFTIDETYCGNSEDPTRRFEMSIQNFAEVVLQWEQLRVSRPDIILVVIHEDYHVSLETDSVIIQEYQDAYGAFNAIEYVRKIKEFLFLKKTAAGYIDTMFSNITSLLYLLPDILLELNNAQENVCFTADTVIITYLYLSFFVYYNHEQDTIYIGSFGKQKDQATTERMLEPENILQHINCFNSFSMSYQDFLVIKASWDEIAEQKRPYFMMYRDAQDVILCQGFDTTDAMINFVKSSMPDQGRMVGDFILD